MVGKGQVVRWAGWALGIAMAGVLGTAWAGEEPELPELTYQPSAVCTAGQPVRVGLKTASAVAVVAQGGVRQDGIALGERTFWKAVRWIGPCPSWDAESGEATNCGWRLRGDDGHLYGRVCLAPVNSGEPLELYREQNGGYQGSVYRGKLYLQINGQGQIQPINELPLESYMCGVVPSEVPARFHEQALRAMACVARTYTLSHLGAHRAQGFDLCDSVHCQAYGGVQGEAAVVSRVVADTAGLILSSNGRPIDATYHAVCGGWGEAPQNVWDKRAALPYLQARTDVSADARLATWSKLFPAGGSCFVDKRQTNGKRVMVLSSLEKAWRDFVDNPPKSFCQAATRFRWRQSYTLQDLRARLRQSLPVTLGAKPESLGERLDLRVTRRSAGGRVAELLIASERGSFKVGGDKIRWLTSGGRIGAEGLKSNFFYVTRQNGEFVFVGCGWGHGAGLCQEGAQGRALAGQDFRQILRHYYPGAVVTPR